MATTSSNGTSVRTWLMFGVYIGLCIFVVGGMVYTQYSDFLAERKTTYIKLRSYAKFSDVFHKINDRWPTNFHEVIMIRKTDRTTTDYYGHEIRYEPYDEAKGYGAVISYGEDGVRGGDKGSEKDIRVRFPFEDFKAWNQTEFYGKTIDE